MTIKRSSATPGITWSSWLVAAGLLVVLVGTAVLLSRSLQQAEDLQVRRYFDSIITHIEADLLANANAQMATQGRMAMRLALDGPFDRVAWSEDASQLIKDYSFYSLLAVLDADYRIRWLEGGGLLELAEGALFPLGRQAFERLENAKSSAGLEMVAIPLERVRLHLGQPALLYMTPILVSGEVAHWLAAVLTVPELIESMLTGFYRRDIVLSGHFTGRDFLPFDDPIVHTVPSRFSRRIEFPLDDGQTVLN
ncbi:MAG: hypothetical protein LC637_14595, partial [Xanthomonadaceae bacterium]|nr:hypothetical protein [Xanthomonadaceae bacterium]